MPEEVSFHTIVHQQKVKILARAKTKKHYDIPDWTVFECPNCKRPIFDYYDDSKAEEEQVYALEVVGGCRIEGVVCPHCNIVIGVDCFPTSIGKDNSMES